MFNILFVIHYHSFVMFNFLFAENNYLFVLLNYLFLVFKNNYLVLKNIFLNILQFCKYSQVWSCFEDLVIRKILVQSEFYLDRRFKTY